MNKPTPWALDALRALSPELAQLAADNPSAAFDRVHGTKS